MFLLGFSADICLYVCLISSQIREQIEFENLGKMYLAELIKKECWEDMDTKGRGLCVGQLLVNIVIICSLCTPPSGLKETVAHKNGAWK